MVDPFSAYLAIGLMAVVTLGTRLGGAFVMRLVTLSPRVTVFLEAMSASVLAAIVATFLVQNGTRELAAVGVALIVMFATRNALPAMFSAMVLAASWTMFGF
ncbi:MAG: AzlD domain-containing protein [Pseudomonadota bacterium]